MNYTDLSESQKAELMDVAIKFLMSTVDGYCANEADANKQEYATRLLLHLKSQVEQILNGKSQTKTELQDIKDNLEGIQLDYDVEGYVSTNTADDLIRYCRELIQEVEQLKVVELAYEAYKSAH